MVAALKKVFRTEEEVYCVGNPKRDIWANLNSCVGLSYARCNVIAQWQAGPLGNGSLHFLAKFDMAAFSEELLWDYPLEFRANANAFSPEQNSSQDKDS